MWLPLVHVYGLYVYRSSVWFWYWYSSRVVQMENEFGVDHVYSVDTFNEMEPRSKWVVFPLMWYCFAQGVFYLWKVFVYTCNNDNIFTGDKSTFAFTINYLHSDNCTRFGYPNSNHELTVQCLTFLDSSTEYLALSGRTIYKSLKEADSKAIW